MHMLLLLLLLIPQLAWAVTRYVSQATGSNSNTCTQAQNISNPRQTIASGLSCTNSGDTLIVRGGTGGSCTVYAEGGFLPANGSAGAYTTIKAMEISPGVYECVHIRPNNMSIDYLFGVTNTMHHV